MSREQEWLYSAELVPSQEAECFEGRSPIRPEMDPVPSTLREALRVGVECQLLETAN